MRTEELPVERAVAEAVRRGADRGVRVVDYASGCRKQPDTVMRRHIVTMTKQASVDRALDICRRAGVALVEVGSHRRPSHREWQGRVYGLDGPVTIEGVHYRGFEESGAADGLMEPNCRHSVAPYIPGRERRWSETPDEDAGDDPEEAYKRRQRQRANERKIRDAKREVAALEAEGLDSARARIRLQRAETAQRNLLADRRTRRRVGQEEAYDASGRRIDIKSSGGISGGLSDKNDPSGRRRRDHAESFYSQIRHRDKDGTVKRVAKAGGVSEEDAAIAVDHVFFATHRLERGEGRFDPDYDMAQSWQRLISGKPEPHDLVLVRHERAEAELMRGGMGYREAHEKANELGYNYEKALDDFLEGRGGNA